MLQLPARLSSFSSPFGHANGSHDLSPTWADLVRAAITCGYPNVTAEPLTYHGAWAVLFRASIVRAFLKATADGRISRSDKYDRADPSEKGSISYYLGLFGAKLAAERLLHTPHLWHYDLYYRAAHGVGPISRRPDLIGKTSAGEWIAIEAKGRTHGLSQSLRTSAKTQARSISDITDTCGAVHSVRANIASIAFFDDCWNLVMEDPPAQPQGLHLAVPMEDLYRSYYEQVLRYITASEGVDTSLNVEIGTVTFRSAYDEALDTYIGISESLVESEGTAGREQRLLVSNLIESHPTDNDRRSSRLVKDRDGSSWSIGEDGIIVRLGPQWTEPVEDQR